jgi:hypothetical protein
MDRPRRSDAALGAMAAPVVHQGFRVSACRFRHIANRARFVMFAVAHFIITALVAAFAQARSGRAA